jgi:hypothetical protein
MIGGQDLFFGQRGVRSSLASQPGCAFDAFRLPKHTHLAAVGVAVPRHEQMALEQ